jgi:hypothetical protein
MKKLNPTSNDQQSWINTIWESLDEAQLYVPFSDEEWDEICTAMMWITEDLGCVDPLKLEVEEK